MADATGPNITVFAVAETRPNACAGAAVRMAVTADPLDQFALVEPLRRGPHRRDLGQDGLNPSTRH